METSSKQLPQGPFPRESGAVVGKWGTGKICKAPRVTLVCSEGGSTDVIIVS